MDELQKVRASVSYELGVIAAAYSTDDLSSTGRYDIPGGFNSLCVAIGEVDIDKFCDGFEGEVGHLGKDYLLTCKGTFDELIEDKDLSAKIWDKLFGEDGIIEEIM